MAHEAKRKAIRMNCVDVDQINLELQLEQEKASEKVRIIKVHKEPMNKEMRRLARKARFNPRYLEEVIPIQRLEYRRNFRNYGLH
ncbi:MAG: hypothetical protein ACFFG0_16045 [Candidatus Thorarchaeota archaeon]